MNRRSFFSGHISKLNCLLNQKKITRIFTCNKGTDKFLQQPPNRKSIYLLDLIFACPNQRSMHEQETTDEGSAELMSSKQVYNRNRGNREQHSFFSGRGKFFCCLSSPKCGCLFAYWDVGIVPSCGDQTRLSIIRSLSVVSIHTLNV
ncbi:hypothetical protein T03_10208 [Trichinella britovi]|uniref:Uncharacterized protein n=1 Tax=Trichinella britovi TaxID=45882 RepID=A0A0V1CDV3_TRIBR|nr:hypothetical protein T03_10208 [Trichinella britovi]